MQLSDRVCAHINMCECVCVVCLVLAFLTALLFLLLLHMSSEVMFGVIPCSGDEVIYDIIFLISTVKYVDSSRWISA